MTSLLLLAASFLVGYGLMRLGGRGRRWRFATEVVFTLAVVLMSLAYDNLLIRAFALIIWPMQLRDFTRAARRAGVLCALTKHDPAARLLVDEKGRRVGELICSDPDHDHGLPEGLTPMPAPCRRCGKQAVA